MDCNCAFSVISGYSTDEILKRRWVGIGQQQAPALLARPGRGKEEEEHEDGQRGTSR